MNQAEAVRQWWAGLTGTEQHAVLRLPLSEGIPSNLALDLAENGVLLKRVNTRAEHAPVLTAFPEVLRDHLMRVRAMTRAVQGA
jgi:hypothetical protein